MDQKVQTLEHTYESGSNQSKPYTSKGFNNFQGSNQDFILPWKTKLDFPRFDGDEPTS